MKALPRNHRPIKCPIPLTWAATLPRASWDAARHIASQTDVDQAYAVGAAAVTMALEGKNAVMPTIIRTPGSRYRWTIGETALAKVANREKKMPRRFISRDGFGITPAAREYFQPLIQGEAYPDYKAGMPIYTRLKNLPVTKRLPTEFPV